MHQLNFFIEIDLLYGIKAKMIKSYNFESIHLILFPATSGIFNFTYERICVLSTLLAKRTLV